MTLQELIEAREEALRLYRKTYSNLSIDYLNSNPHFNIGDVLKSRTEVGRVLKIKPSINMSDIDSEPKVMYFCEILKADGKQRKKPYQEYLYGDVVKF